MLVHVTEFSHEWQEIKKLIIADKNTSCFNKKDINPTLQKML
jgi:hypothetical protein